MMVSKTGILACPSLPGILGIDFPYIVSHFSLADSTWKCNGLGLVPQGGYGLKPRVAASATLGWLDIVFYPERVASPRAATALRLTPTIQFQTQGSRSGNPGL